MELLQEELERYNRNILLTGIGKAGQLKLKNASVFVAGAGGLGSPILYYLTASGVGNIGICDGDVVDTSNLQRQILHNTQDLNKNKADSAFEKLHLLNPNLNLKIFKEHLTPQNILTHIKNYEIIVEATDILSAKFLINDACVLANKTLVRASALAFSGQAMSVQPKKSACYACLFNAPPKMTMPTGATIGILGAVAGLFGCIQANEVIKIITGVGVPLFDKLLTCDVRSMDFRTITIKRNPNCRVCGDYGITKLDSTLY
ncbi:HesA/MoeB/ThiF family protein [Helicobacter sp.]|uniref:HesA/MoeB/ThiF family protein n=1 Tax=Helicobacter sp. TaxID=218 RepID=UPI0025BDF402|nr:HesA/MoeB/ThiF family protein [Helicobacter sp.]MCI5968352.1 HesA/MoeB/ThiF family protein [Helicobacter sp.]MDY2584839.1 HesA/MoeB/ThiF family protein [Helicobacter sp.]